MNSDNKKLLLFGALFIGLLGLTLAYFYLKGKPKSHPDNPDKEIIDPGPQPPAISSGTEATEPLANACRMTIADYKNYLKDLKVNNNGVKSYIATQITALSGEEAIYGQAKTAEQKDLDIVKSNITNKAKDLYDFATSSNEKIIMYEIK